MAAFNSTFQTDLAKPSRVVPIPDTYTRGDNESHTITVLVYDSANPSCGLMAGSVSAAVARQDGNTIPLTTGTKGAATVPVKLADGSTAQATPCTVTLKQACFDCPGQVVVVIRLVSGETITSIFVGSGKVNAGLTNSIIDPGDVITDITALIAAAEQAAEDAEEALAQATAVVSYAEQTGKTDAQKAQARTNIGAASDADVTDLKGATDSIGNAFVTDTDSDEVTLTNIENVQYYKEHIDSIAGFSSATYSSGVMSLTNNAQATVTSPYFAHSGSWGEKKWICGFKYRLTKLDQSIPEPDHVRIHLGASQKYDDDDIAWGEWVSFAQVATVDLTRIRFSVQDFPSVPPAQSFQVEIKDMYIYDATDVKDKTCEYIIAQQNTNYTDGTVTYSYGETTYATDTTLAESGKVADSKTVGDAIALLATKADVNALNVPQIKDDLYGTVSINLFNKNDPDMLTGGKYIDTDGTEKTASGYNESGYIACENGDTFTFTKNGNYFGSSRPIVFYDAEKQFLSGITGYMPTITISGSSIKYFRAPITNSELDVTMIVKNDSTIHDYVPYGIVGGALNDIEDNTEDIEELQQTISSAGILPWNGKSVVCLGDSIMYNDVHSEINGYPYYISQLGFSTVTNKGVSGACVALHSESQYEDICTTVDNVNFASYDLAIIAGGTNDFGFSSASPIGTLINSATASDFDKTTFIGALQYIITKALNSNVAIKIALFTPLKRSGWYTPNSEGKVLKDYADAIKEVAEYYSSPVLDYYAMSGINRKNLWTFTSDGLHPNNDGYEFICINKLTSFINSL